LYAGHAASGATKCYTVPLRSTHEWSNLAIKVPVEWHVDELDAVTRIIETKLL